jgi:hypothetical protein
MRPGTLFPMDIRILTGSLTSHTRASRMEVTTTEDPVRYFADFDVRESRLVSVRYDPEARELAFAIWYAGIQRILERVASGQHLTRDPDRQYDRDFRLLVFASAAEVERRGTLYSHGFRGFDAHDLNVPPSGQLRPVIESVTILAKEEPGTYRGEIVVGSLGVYSFSFSALHVHRRLGKAVAVGEQQWDYFDIANGGPINIYDPFPADDDTEIE